MKQLVVLLSVDDVNQLYKEVSTNTPPEGVQNARGFEQLSPDGDYLLTFWVQPDGSIEIRVRPPRGSYEALENLTYGEIADIVGSQ